MIIYFRAGSELRERLKPDIDQYTRRVNVQEGYNVREILKTIGIEPSLVALVYTEGKVVGFDYIPRDGQTITIQPPVSGG